MSYVFNFLVEILLILPYDLGYTDLTTKDSPFHMMCVVGLEVQTTASFRYTFMVSSGLLFKIKTSKNRGLSLASTSIVNLMVGVAFLRW
jgi:hypothetical protein